MTNPLVAYFPLHPIRSTAALQKLLGDWQGILVSDNYGVYQHWQGLRQTCFAHLIRTATGLAEHRESRIAMFGRKIRDVVKTNRDFRINHRDVYVMLALRRSFCQVVGYCHKF